MKEKFDCYLGWKIVLSFLEEGIFVFKKDEVRIVIANDKFHSFYIGSK